MKDQTRTQLIEAARILFIRQGFDATTMGEVAQVAKRGRRTLYYYYPNKKVLLRAVAESELGRIYDVLEAVVEKDIPANDKLVEFVITRLNNVRHSIARNGSLRSDPALFLRVVESARNRSESREIALVERILMQGIHEGIFHVENLHYMAQVIHYTTKGLEKPYVRGDISSGYHDMRMLERTARKILQGALR